VLHAEIKFVAAASLLVLDFTRSHDNAISSYHPCRRHIRVIQFPLNSNYMSKKYTIEIVGWSVKTTAHSLNAKQAKIVQEYAKANNIMLNDLLESMESVIDNYDHYDTNLWAFEASLLDDLNIYLEEEDGNEILKFTINETSGDIDKNHLDLLTYSALPKAESPNVLVYQEDNKGVIYGCIFESVSTPSPKDFTFKCGRLITPDGDLTFIQTFYFRGEELEEDYEFNSASNIGTTSRLFLRETNNKN
jgi:hypothetical protein